ncbi:hypothetical protein L5515_019721 [Caenorhabditis briggsae]|uniref:VWFA domain-containing protein n=1 Tax=Caenorhabditis briggsae TaxID=6238 RepID=A0AAE9FL20_CAEBR|nr:hypothetical protein L5515_019721 [Caenorhabditis briggsae]
MGWKLAAFLLALSIKYTNADCTCYEQANYTGFSAPLSNSFETSDFSACFTPCKYVAYSGNDTFGWGGLTINWGSVKDNSGILQIFDGTDITGIPLIQVSAGTNVLSGSTKNLIKSSQPRITITYTQTGTEANNYNGVIKASSGLQPSTVPITTTAAPTTRTYNDPTFKYDPYLITHDIMIVVNQKTSGGMAALTQLNEIVNNTVMQLYTTTDINSSTGSRLSLASLTPYFPYYSIRTAIWESSAFDVVNNLPKSGISIEGNIDTALTGLVKLAYTVNNNSSIATRTNVQRSVVLFTAEWPTTGANLSTSYVKKAFDDYGVNLLVVGFNLTDNEKTALMGGASAYQWYNAVNTNKTTNDAVASFVNPYYFNDKSAPNFWCPMYHPTSSDNSSFTFQEPYNYDGPNSTTGQWSVSFDGQTGRYCNFASNQYTISRPDNADGMNVTVFYELEAGKDFLNFYDASNNLIASFTGYDISSSSFYTTTPVLTARFTSDNQSVFRGFNVNIKPNPKPT